MSYHPINKREGMLEMGGVLSDKIVVGKYRPPIIKLIKDTKAYNCNGRYRWKLPII